MVFQPDERVLDRLTEDEIAWLTTVTPGGRPAPRPVWFLWTDGGCMVYSQPDAAKLRHLERNDQATLSFNSSSTGGDIVVLHGRAARAPDAPPPERLPGLLDKYAALLDRIGMTAEHFTSTYSVPLRFVPERAWTVA